MDRLPVFIGWDSREDIAFQVAKKTLIENASIPVDVYPIKLDELVADGLYSRDIDPLAATEFTYSRFFTPHLAGFEGWALFIDCDFLFFGDVAELSNYMSDEIAVACVKHEYTPKNETKMDGQIQTIYPRKNWSSFMLLNCSHPSTIRLTAAEVNSQSGAYLHRMQWAADDEIGDIPLSWNFLEGVYEKNPDSYPNAVHFTNGGPWFDQCQDVDYADEWRKAAADIS